MFFLSEFPWCAAENYGFHQTMKMSLRGIFGLLFVRTLICIPKWESDHLPSCHNSIITLIPDMPEHVLSHALKTPAMQRLKGKRIVLASNSLRRKEILRTFVRVNWNSIDCLLPTHCNLLLGDILCVGYTKNIWNQGLSPEIVPSTFEENLAISQFADIHEYPVATATHKAVEVYENLVVSIYNRVG